MTDEDMNACIFCTLMERGHKKKNKKLEQRRMKLERNKGKHKKNIVRKNNVVKTKTEE